MPRDDALWISELSLMYEGERHVMALRNVSLTIKESEFVALVGPSGCGKSSLLHVIAGFLAATQGSCYSFGERVAGPGPDRAILFQRQSLFPWKTALGNVMYPLQCRKVDRIEAANTAQCWLRELGLGGFEQHYAWQLSGGMQQRVALARLYASSPKIFLMDEPFGALDAHTKLEMQETLLTIWEEHSGTVLFVTHDIEEALFLADRVLVMSARPGSIVEEFSVPLRRPRKPDALYSPEIMALRAHVFSIMRQQHRKRALRDHPMLSPSDERELRIGYVPDAASLPLLTVVDELTNTGKYGIELFEEPNGDAVVDAVDAGVYDLGINSLVAAIASAERGARFKILVGWTRVGTEGGHLAGLCLSSVIKEEAVAARGSWRIAVNGLNTLPGFLVRRYFQQFGQSPELASLYHGTFEYALREGFVEGVATMEPWLSDVCQSTESGVNIWLDDYIPPGATFVVIANKGRVNSQEAVISVLLRHWRRRWESQGGLADTQSSLIRGMGGSAGRCLAGLVFGRPKPVEVGEVEEMSRLMKEVGMVVPEMEINWQQYLWAGF